MTYRIATSAACLVLAAAITLPTAAKEPEAKTETVSKGEAELAEMLDGYEAGLPVKCLNRSQRDRLRVIDDTALVFRDGKTLYVNRTSAPRYLDEFDIPVFKPFGSRLCRMDQVEMVERSGNFGGPIFTLKEFVPYTKIDTEE